VCNDENDEKDSFRRKVMTFRTVFGVTLVGLLVCADLVIPGHAQARRLRVAVYPFNQSNVEFNIAKEVGSKINYGEVVADMLGTELAATFDVINRNQMARLLEEQGRKYDERFDPSAAPEFGRLLGVDAIVSGSITTLYVDKQVSDGIGGKISSGLGILGNKTKVDTAKTNVEAHAELTAQIISTVTGQTLTGSQSKGVFAKQVQGNLQVGVDNTGKGSSSSSNSGSDPFIRSALQQAVHDVAERFAAGNASAPRLNTTTPQAASAAKAAPPAQDQYLSLPDELGNVRRLDGTTLSFFLAPGVKLVVGEVLSVQHPESSLNPRTGKQVLVGETIGSLKLTTVKGEMAEGTYEGKPVTDKDRVVKK